MDSNRFAIAYSPGCFGSFLSVILFLQSNRSPTINLDSPSSHEVHEFYSTKDNIKTFHKGKFSPEDEVDFKKYRTLFPYFPQTHIFLGPYMHYLKFFKRLPQVDNFQEFDIKSIPKDRAHAHLDDTQIFFQSVVTHFWRKEVPSPVNVFPINLLDLFTDLPGFKKDLEECIEQKLTQRTMDFITAKLQLNQPIFNKYQQSVNDNIDKIRQGIDVDLTRIEDILQCFLIARLIDSNSEKYTLFLRTLHPQHAIDPNSMLQSLITKDK
jgi:hypothetical protein|tara:strand:+ start:936 stop:1733 length:798 start_codon:yes stop_codon:yes gene_type:complete